MQVDALLAAWRPGEEGGTAIVNLITGKAAPTAKLAQSWPRTVGRVHLLASLLLTSLCLAGLAVSC